MLLKLESPKLFSDIVGIISVLVNEVRLKLNKEGMSVTAIDPANVAMIHFKIPADLFSEFNVDKDETLGINLENLKAVLRRCGPSSALTLQKEEENSLKMIIQDRIKREFIISLIDIEVDEKELPEWEFKSVIKLDSGTFEEVIEDCLVVSDACTFNAHPDKFTIEAHGLNSVKADFSTEEAEIFSGEAKARFSLEYLAKFAKGAKISSTAKINFADNHPMRLDFPTGNVLLSFILAPRVEQED